MRAPKQLNREAETAGFGFSRISESVFNLRLDLGFPSRLQAMTNCDQSERRLRATKTIPSSSPPTKNGMKNASQK